MPKRKLETNKAELVGQLIRNNELITKIISDFAGTDLPDPSTGDDNPWPPKDYMEYNLYGPKQPRQAERVRLATQIHPDDYMRQAQYLRQRAVVRYGPIPKKRSKKPIN